MHAAPMVHALCALMHVVPHGPLRHGSVHAVPHGPLRRGSMHAAPPWSMLTLSTLLWPHMCSSSTVGALVRFFSVSVRFFSVSGFGEVLLRLQPLGLW